MPSLIAMLSIIFGCGGDGGSGETVNTQVTGGASVVLTGQIDEIPESRGIFVWGDSINKLCQQWSVAVFDQSGWFYGTSNPTSSADVYVLFAPDDPLSVVAAENFEYTAGIAQAAEGDTVFFRGRNGFFGAWTINEIEGENDAVLSGDWYFKAGGGGDFTRAIQDGGPSNHDAGTGVCDGY